MGTYYSSYVKNHPLVELLVKNQDSEISFKCQAIFDTGATITCVSWKFAQKLGLKFLGRINYLSVSGKGYTYKSQLSIIFPSNLKYFSKKKTAEVFAIPTELILFKKQIMVVPLEHQDIDLLIGIDLISEGNFYINNGYFSFEISKKQFIVQSPKLINEFVSKIKRNKK